MSFPRGFVFPALSALLLVFAGCQSSSDGGWLGQSFGPGDTIVAPLPIIPAMGTHLGAILLEGQTPMVEFNAQVGKPHALFGEFFRFPEAVRPGNNESGRLDRFLSDCQVVKAMAFVTLETFGGLDSSTSADQQAMAGFPVPGVGHRRRPDLVQGKGPVDRLLEQSGIPLHSSSEALSITSFGSRKLGNG